MSVFLAGRPAPPRRGAIRIPADVLIEVVSPSPRDERRDRVEKMAEYAAFGVRYDWLLDPALGSFEIFERTKHERGFAVSSPDVVSRHSRYATYRPGQQGGCLPAGTATRRATQDHGPLVPLAARFALALVPLGLGVWVAHYAVHFLTGLWTVVPVVQEMLAGAGLPLLGEPNWRLGGLPPVAVLPLEVGFVGLGFAGSLLVAWHIAEREFGARARHAFLPWAALATAVWAAATWLMTQPMEMRGTVRGG